MSNMGYKLFIVLKGSLAISIGAIDGVFHLTVTYLSAVHLSMLKTTHIW